MIQKHKGSHGPDEKFSSGQSVQIFGRNVASSVDIMVWNLTLFDI